MKQRPTRRRGMGPRGTQRDIRTREIEHLQEQLFAEINWKGLRLRPVSGAGPPRQPPTINRSVPGEGKGGRDKGPCGALVLSRASHRLARTGWLAQAASHRLRGPQITHSSIQPPPPTTTTTLPTTTLPPLPRQSRCAAAAAHACEPVGADSTTCLGGAGPEPGVPGEGGHRADCCGRRSSFRSRWT